jgi:phosphomannomutase
MIENRNSTRDAVLKHQADMGIAWDGDFDRCFLFDEKGQFIEALGVAPNSRLRLKVH